VGAALALPGLASANDVSPSLIGGTVFSDSDRDIQSASDTFALSVGPRGARVATLGNGVDGKMFVYVYDAVGHQRVRFVAPDATQIALDGAGHIVVASAAGSIARRDARGRPVNGFSTGLPVTALAADVPGDIYVASARQVNRYSPQGVLRTSFGSGAIGRAAGLAVDGAGDVYVSDAGNRRIEEFAPSGALLRTIGGPGPADGALTEPGAVGVDQAGDVLVVNSPSTSGGVRTYTPAGRYVGPFQLALTTAASFPFAPTLLAVAPSGDVYVTDMNPDVTRVPAAQLTSPSFIVRGGGPRDLSPRFVTVGRVVQLGIDVYPSPASGLRANLAVQPGRGLELKTPASVPVRAPAPDASSPASWSLTAARAGRYDVTLTASGTSPGGQEVSESEHLSLYALAPLRARVLAAQYLRRDGVVTVAADLGDGPRRWAQDLTIRDALNGSVAPVISARLDGHLLAAESFSLGGIVSGMCQGFVVPKRLAHRRRRLPLVISIGDRSADPAMVRVIGRDTRIRAGARTRNPTLLSCADALARAGGR